MASPSREAGYHLSIHYKELAEQIPCYAGKIQGIFAIQANFRPSRADYLTEKRSFFSQIPYSAEQGIFLTLSGNNRETSGNR
jgi:hypothetical protein